MKHLPISWGAEIALFLKSVVGGKVDLVISESVFGNCWRRHLGASESHQEVTALVIWVLSEVALVVCLGGGSRRHWQGSGEVRQEREGSQQRVHFRAGCHCG